MCEEEILSKSFAIFLAQKTNSSSSESEGVKLKYPHTVQNCKNIRANSWLY